MQQEALHALYSEWYSPQRGAEPWVGHKATEGVLPVEGPQIQRREEPYRSELSGGAITVNKLG
ncbi:MAG: hypothetical protein AB7P69_21260 [Candidatus Binatia bacterium]